MGIYKKIRAAGLFGGNYLTYIPMTTSPCSMHGPGHDSPPHPPSLLSAAMYLGMCESRPLLAMSRLSGADSHTYAPSQAHLVLAMPVLGDTNGDGTLNINLPSSPCPHTHQIPFANCPPKLSPFPPQGAALMKMAFMQKAMEKQRERAREEASVVLRELEEASAAAADADGSDDDEAVRRKRSNKRRGKAGDAAGTAEDVGVASKETRAEATAEVAKALPAGALQSSAVSMDARVRSSVASPITIDLGGGSGPVLSSAEDTAETLNGSKKKSTGGGGKAGTEERPKKRRQEEADGGVADRDLEGEEEEDDDQQDGKSNPWLAPTPRRSKSRRRAPNGEVLLDVRKAAATALSAFGGKEGPSGSGDAADDVVEHEGGGGAKDAENDSAGPLSSGKKKSNKKNKNKSPPNEQAEQEQGGGRKKRKRRKRGGGGGAGDVNGHEGTSGDGTNGEGTEARATTDKAGGGNKKAKTAASEPNGNSGVKRSGQSSTATPKLVGLSNDELVRRAFAAPDFESEFKDSKDDEIEGEITKGREKLPGTLAGWGAWAGDGAPAPRGPTKHQVQAKNAQVCYGCIARRKKSRFASVSRCTRLCIHAWKGYIDVLSYPSPPPRTPFPRPKRSRKRKPSRRRAKTIGCPRSCSTRSARSDQPSEQM